MRHSSPSASRPEEFVKGRGNSTLHGHQAGSTSGNTARGSGHTARGSGHPPWTRKRPAILEDNPDDKTPFEAAVIEKTHEAADLMKRPLTEALFTQCLLLTLSTEAAHCAHFEILDSSGSNPRAPPISSDENMREEMPTLIAFLISIQ